jgi:hypothetical protein
VHVTIVHLVVSVLLVASLAVVPPEDGPMTLISLNNAEKSQLFEFARENNLKITGSTAIPNAVAVWGRRPSIASLWNNGSVVISGDFAGCEVAGAGQ